MATDVLEKLHDRFYRYFKGGYLNCLHLIELDKIYMLKFIFKKQYKSLVRIIKLRKKTFLWSSLKGYVAS